MCFLALTLCPCFKCVSCYKQHPFLLLVYKSYIYPSVFSPFLEATSLQIAQYFMKGMQSPIAAGVTLETLISNTWLSVFVSPCWEEEVLFVGWLTRAETLKWCHYRSRSVCRWPFPLSIQFYVAVWDSVVGDMFICFDKKRLIYHWWTTLVNVFREEFQGLVLNPYDFKGLKKYAVLFIIDLRLLTRKLKVSYIPNE